MIILYWKNEIIPKSLGSQKTQMMLRKIKQKSYFSWAILSGSLKNQCFNHRFFGNIKELAIDYRRLIYHWDLNSVKGIYLFFISYLTPFYFGSLTLAKYYLFRSLLLAVGHVSFRGGDLNWFRRSFLHSTYRGKELLQT